MHEVIESVICTELKDMTRIFDNYIPCRKRGCMLEHVWSWLKLRILFEEEWAIKTIRRMKGVIEIG